MVSVSVTYFRKYHADWSAIEAELRERCTEQGDDRSIRTSEEAGQTTVSWWFDWNTVGLTAEQATIELMQRTEGAGRLLSHRPPDLITTTIRVGPYFYSLNRTPNAESQREREAIAAQVNAQ